MTKTALRLARKMAVDNFVPKVYEVYRAIYSPLAIEDMPEVPTITQLRWRLFRTLRKPCRFCEFQAINRDGSVFTRVEGYPDYHIDFIWTPRIVNVTYIPESILIKSRRKK